MNTIGKGLLMGAIVGGTLLSNANADQGKTKGMVSEKAQVNQLLSDAAKTFRDLRPESVPDSVKRNARCVAVVPRVVTAAAVVGGSHGDGVATCKLSDGKWSTPSFVDLNEGSVGAQVGGKSESLVLYITGAQAADALRRGAVQFGADASVVAGTFDRSFDVGNAGVVAYKQGTGAYVGASVSGGRLSADPETNTSYYGKQIEQNVILAQDNSVIEPRDPFTSQLQ